MATIGSATTSSHLNTPRRSYLTTAVYDTQFYTLESSYNKQTWTTTYSLVPVQGSSPSTCQKGAILRETGRKIYPGQYPGVSPDSYYVSVFDDASHLTGYINPNASIFLPLNTDKPSNVYGPNGFSDDAEQGNQGPPVYTQGDIIADGDATIGGNLDVSGNVLADGNANIGGYISTSHLYVGAAGSAATVGKVVLTTGGYSTVTTQGYNSTTSYVFLSYVSPVVGAGAATSNYLYSSNVGPSTFTIRSANTADTTSRVNWFIVN